MDQPIPSLIGCSSAGNRDCISTGLFIQPRPNADATAPMIYFGERGQVGDYRFRSLLMLTGLWPVTLALAYGFWARRNWSRHIAVGIYLLALVIGMVIERNNIDGVELLIAVLVATILVWYLYGKHSVKAYFGGA